MTEIILLRHGETDANRELRFQGQVNEPLNSIGHEQARRLAARLEGVACHALISSDLRRALQTAEPIAARLRSDPVADSGLREQAFGTVDGWRADEIRAQLPEQWTGWQRFDADFAFPGGAESGRVFHARVLDRVRHWSQRYAGGRLVLVAHGGVLDMVYRTALGQSLHGPRQAAIPNAGFNRVMVHDDRIDILEWADVTHLQGMGPQPVYVQRAATETPGGAGHSPRKHS